MVELVTDYLDGALSPRERRRFEEHIAACEACSAYLEQLRQLRAQLGGLVEEDVPPQIAQELGEAFRTWRSSRGPS